MNTLDRADAYLTIPPGYAASLGGLRWSSRRDAVERADGTTLAVADEIRAVLAGVFASPRVPPFAFVLNLLHLMKGGDHGHFARLRVAFTGTRGVADRGRNVGRLIAELCRELPPAAGELTGPDVATALQFLRLYGEHSRPDRAEEPPLPRDTFERHAAERLADLPDAALLEWFISGTGPSRAGGRLAEEVESLPDRLAKLLALARRRARLVGAATLVPALDAALTFPPRHRSPDAPPQGGYCDVGTRGEPERLLPAQFALDPDEFVRRFAERELLYFQREQPHQPERPDRVIVLDQGVRTWGSLRLGLAAAAFSLLSAGSKRGGAVRLFLTSHPGPLDLTGRGVEAVAALEASDLTTDPGSCLELALESGDEATPRDVILLTHPRSLREKSVTAAATGSRAADRLFALTLDDAGRAELVEWRSGGPVSLRTFRVDLAKAESARPEGEARPSRRAPGGEPPWAGDVEPVPFPFRPGLVAEPQLFGFDADGEWLVAACRGGVLHGLALDGSPAEVLPRPFRGGVVLDEIESVLGVTGGVVVCGRMRPGPTGATANYSLTTHSPADAVLTAAASSIPAAIPEQYVAAHYDRACRRVALHFLGPTAGTARWSAFPDLHCVAVRPHSGAGRAVDLATSGQFPGKDDSARVTRAGSAWVRAEKGGSPPHSLPIVPPSDPPEPLDSLPFLRHSDGMLRVRGASPAWGGPFEPLADGKPMLEGATLWQAQLAGDVIALSFAAPAGRKLALLRGPDGVVIREAPPPFRGVLALSPDGKVIATRQPDRTVVVAETAAPGRPLATAPHAGLHDTLAVRLDADPFRLTIAVGTFAHSFRLHEGVLRYSLALGWDQLPEPKGPTAGISVALGYDTARFPPSEGASAGPWRAALDRLGQVLLFARGLVVASFVVRRERAAVWIPGGALWGEPSLIGGPPTSNAERTIGQALRAAGG